MDPRTRTNLWMAAVVALLAALTIYTQRPDTPQLPRLGGPMAAAVVEIRIEHGQAEAPIRLIRRDGGWLLMEAGGAVPANRRIAGTLAALGDAPSLAVYQLSGVDAARLGLQPPRARVWLNDVEYRFGAQEPIAYRRYVQLGDRVHLITDTLYRHVMGSRLAFIQGDGG